MQDPGQGRGHGRRRPSPGTWASSSSSSPWPRPPGSCELPLLVRIGLARVLLVAAYVYYVRRTLHSGGALEEVPERLTLWRFRSGRRRGPSFSGAPRPRAHRGRRRGLRGGRGARGRAIGLPAGLVALVLAPLATELPEKINSVIWVRDGKDTLALGNITGAMVFQSTVPVTFGVLFTNWELGPLNLFSAALALVSGGLHLHGAQARRAAPLLAPDARRALLPGLPRRRRVRGHLTPYSTCGQTRTGPCEAVTTLVETLPSLVRMIPVRPWLPTATREGQSSWDASNKTVAG